MPGAKAVHVDQILTNLSLQYKNMDMIWPFLMPTVKVGKRSDKYFIYDKKNAFTLPDDKLGPKSMPNEYDWAISSDSYSVKDHGLGDWLPQEVIDNADGPLSPEADTNDFLNMLLDVAQEKRVADIIFAAATYDASHKVQLSGTGQWGGTADNPIGDVMTAVEGCFLRANTLVFGAEAWTKYRQLPEVLDAVKTSTRQQSTPGGLAMPSEVAALFEVDRILVGRGIYVSTKEGQTSTYTKLWGKHCAALHVAQNPGVRTITFGLTFSEMLRQTQRDFDPKRGAKGAHFFKVAWNSDEKTTAADCGYFIQDAVA